jgi:hypothetical protein
VNGRLDFDYRTAGQRFFCATPQTLPGIAACGEVKRDSLAKTAKIAKKNPISEF